MKQVNMKCYRIQSPLRLFNDLNNKQEQLAKRNKLKRTHDPQMIYYDYVARTWATVPID